MASTLLTIAAPVAAKPLPLDQIDFGPEPGWTKFHAIAEEAVRNRLVDPDSAKFDWPWGYHKGGFKPLLEGWVYGYYTCGTVNSRNRMGGYAGRSTFLVLMNYDRVLYVDFGTNKGLGLVDETCTKAIRQGLLSPRANDTPSAPVSATDTGGVFDFEFIASPDGARVTRAEQVALESGLRPGMVITTINGIALKSLPPEVVTQIIRATPSPATITILGGTVPLIVRRAPILPAQPAGGQ